MSNITCFKHSTYRGDTPPDLSCKACCSKFVARIRAEQSAKFEELQKVSRSSPVTNSQSETQSLRMASSEVKPSALKPVQKTSAQKSTFDASWI
jgi:hypothetical protein